MTPELVVIPNGSGPPYRLWPACDSIPAGTIQEYGRHIFELRGIDPDTVDLSIEGTSLKALKNPNKNTARWEWDAGFYAGKIDAALLISGREITVELTLDPDLRKLSREAFDVMVLECLEDLAAIFSLSPAKMGFARGSINPPLARLEFIRSRIARLVSSVSSIIARPHRFLAAEETTIAIGKARRIDSARLHRSLRFGQCTAIDPRRFPHIRPKVLPSRVLVARRSSSLDNPENRSVKNFLTRCAAWLERASISLGVATGPELRGTIIWSKRCAELSRHLRHALADDFFAEVGDGDDSRAAQSGSPVFRSAAGYQQFARIRRELEFGLAAFVGDWLNMPLARTHDLYELWVYLRFVRCAMAVSGTGPHMIEGVAKQADGSLFLPRQSISAAIGTDIKVVFQRSYKEYWSSHDRQGTFSREMIPDVAITTSRNATGRKLVVLDAKYRVEQGLNDALASIHTYRDSLVAERADGATEDIVSGAFIVSPHVALDLESDWKALAAPNRFFHPRYRNQFRFGAVTMRPGETSLDDVGRILKQILSDVGA